MPMEFIGFTSGRRISASLPLADDRLSDMLNAVARLVLRDATVVDLGDGRASPPSDLVVPVGELIVVVGSGRRGSETRRRRTAVRTITIGLDRFVVRGSLHVPADRAELPPSLDPAVVLAGRDTLVPLTAATITYDCADVATAEEHGTLLVNRARAMWIEVDSVPLDDDGLGATPARRHATPVYLKDFTGSVAD
jgi:hypothetical protein